MTSAPRSPIWRVAVGPAHPMVRSMTVSYTHLDVYKRQVALRDVADAGVDRLLRLDQAFLRIGLVVERNDLHLLAEDAALGIQFVGEKLKGLEADFSDTGAAPRQRVDIADLHGVLRHRATGKQRHRQHRSHHHFAHDHPPWMFSCVELLPGTANGISLGEIDACSG